MLFDLFIYALYKSSSSPVNIFVLIKVVYGKSSYINNSHTSSIYFIAPKNLFLQLSLACLSVTGNFYVPYNLQIFSVKQL